MFINIWQEASLASFPFLVLCVRVSFVDPSPFYKAPGVCLFIWVSFLNFIHPFTHHRHYPAAKQTKPYPTLLFDTIKTLLILLSFLSHHITH
ncbi:GPI-anchored surface protein, putative [Bodo saltans]|uniref:GPI-anchored surface protein, putative n=1 Tax=Bodo saltans TaxID=75058 RepID=A0A0S4IZK0_BODSA|nr:GPI-anchored surface protein, putative [Bodo saltans]|eukprot:CUF92313.1 GPI-anchored surface protein, putative [Bodo saltans]